MVVRATFPELRATATRLIDAQDYRFLYDRTAGRMSHGYYVHLASRSPFHYAVLYAESRLGSLMAIGKGDVPAQHWFRMVRTFPPTLTVAGGPASRTPVEGCSRACRLRRLVRVGWRALRPIVGRKRVRDPHADARSRRAAPCASEPRRQRPGARARAATLRARDAQVSGVGYVTERDAGGRRLRRVRRARPRFARVSRRSRDTARLGAGPRRHPRGGDREPSPTRRVL